mmetsp:Transcript_82929/g.222454  ORF Transcript_82929/g.222454 Transcript_82929/m.222454 type:complete len:233 (+) Transcript_82929:26-724(+)
MPRRSHAASSWNSTLGERRGGVKRGRSGSKSSSKAAFCTSRSCSERRLVVPASDRVSSTAAASSKKLLLMLRVARLTSGFRPAASFLHASLPSSLLLTSSSLRPTILGSTSAKAAPSTLPREQLLMSMLVSAGDLLRASNSSAMPPERLQPLSLRVEIFHPFFKASAISVKPLLVSWFPPMSSVVTWGAFRSEATSKPTPASSMQLSLRYSSVNEVAFGRISAMMAAPASEK